MASDQCRVLKEIEALRRSPPEGLRSALAGAMRRSIGPEATLGERLSFDTQCQN